MVHFVPAVIDPVEILDSYLCSNARCDPLGDLTVRKLLSNAILFRFWFNLIFLLLIVLTPFPTSMLTKYGSYQVAVVFYATSVAAIGLMLSLLWGYASRHHRLVV
jgi:hypothetical protein